MQHTHDLRIAAIQGGAVGADDERLESVDGTGEHGRARRLRDDIGLAGEVGLVHGPVPLEDSRVDGADLMREEDEFVADLDAGHVEIGEPTVASPTVRDRRAPPGQRLEHL